jgi:hypothetical protein
MLRRVAAGTLPCGRRRAGPTEGACPPGSRPAAGGAGGFNGLYHLKYLPVTGGGHLRWPWEGPRSRRFPGELRARERDRRPGLVSPKQARFRELVVGAEPPRGPVMT